MRTNPTRQQGRRDKQDGKWIAGLSPSMPLAVGARRVLEARLNAVKHRLPPALEQSHRDVEHVHQLRVATRRCRAALDLFAGCLPAKEHRMARRQLRRIRRAAGEARDADVFLLSLQTVLKSALPEHLPGLHWLAGQTARLRMQAQEQLAATCSPAKLKQVIDDTLAGVETAEEQPATLAELGAARIIPLLDHLEQLGQGDLKSDTHLHRIRIEGKHLRYTLEVLADCLPDAFRKELYPLVENMQEILGQINDSHVASARIGELRQTARRFWPSLYRDWRRGIEVLLRHHRRQLARERRRFLRFWAGWQDSNAGQRFGGMLFGS